MSDNTEAAITWAHDVLREAGDRAQEAALRRELAADPLVTRLAKAAADRADAIAGARCPSCGPLLISDTPTGRELRHRAGCPAREA